MSITARQRAVHTCGAAYNPPYRPTSGIHVGRVDTKKPASSSFYPPLDYQRKHCSACLHGCNLRHPRATRAHRRDGVDPLKAIPLPTSPRIAILLARAYRVIRLYQRARCIPPLSTKTPTSPLGANLPSTLPLALDRQE